MEQELISSIFMYVLIILGVIALLSLVVLLFNIGRKIKSHLENQQLQQDRINQNTMQNFEQIHLIVDPLVTFVDGVKNHMEHNMAESKKLRQYAMDNQLQMIKLTELYEVSIKKLDKMEERVSIICEKLHVFSNVNGKSNNHKIEG